MAEIVFVMASSAPWLIIVRLNCQREGSDLPCVSQLQLRAEDVQFEEDRPNRVTGITVRERHQELIISVSNRASNAA